MKRLGGATEEHAKHNQAADYKPENWCQQIANEAKKPLLIYHRPLKATMLFVI